MTTKEDNKDYKTRISLNENLLLAMWEVQFELVKTEHIIFQNENKFCKQYLVSYHFDLCINFHTMFKTLVKGMAWLYNLHISNFLLKLSK